MKNLKMISSENLFFNLQKFSDKKICAMVKANAYGHGMKEIVSLLSGRVDYFGVVSVEEGVRVRKLCDTPVLICARAQDLKKCKKYNLEVMVESENDIKECVKAGLDGMMHLKINCGMNRFGCSSALELKMIDRFLKEKEIQLKSIYTHFPRTQSAYFTKKCYKKFMKLRTEISQKVPLCFGGSGMKKYNFQFDMLRVGIGLYGYEQKDLKKVMRVDSYVSKIFFAKRGQFVGYGKKFRVRKSGFFAVVPVGYGDGLHRALSGKFKVKIGKKKYRCVGNICMDAFFVRVDENVKVGDEVTVMDDAQCLAKKCGTISYEMLTSFSKLRGRTKIV